MNARSLVAPLLVLTCSCVPAYRPPTADEPHATLKIRRTYERPAGERLIEACTVDGHPLFRQTTPVAVAGAPRTDGVLVHPIPAALEVAAEFVHSESRLVREPYTEQESYVTSEMYSCGTTLCTRTVTRYRTVTKYRDVLRNVDVTDGACKRPLNLVAAKDGVYLVDFTYRDNGVCGISCVAQTASTDGSFTNTPCTLATDAQVRAVHEAE